MVVHLLRWADLLEDPAGEHRDPIAERDRLDLVVGDVDRRHSHPAVQPLQLGPHLDPQLRVEVRQRLVQEEHLRLAHQRASHRDALPLPPGELSGTPAEQVLQAEHPTHLVDAAADLVAGHATLAEAEREVPFDTVMCG